ncbi:MAG: GCN5-related N-acetyltransferase [Anaerocolumna sp.]|jgi:diamine N-acetyltransferase|nr:GCN5-related N-acetyltransferase [Anaerocolumna sp.]
MCNVGGVIMQVRELKKKDAILMEEWMKNEDISNSFQYEFTKTSIEKCEKFIVRAQRDVKSLHLAIVDDNDEYMGTVSLKNIDFINRKSEYAIVLRKVAIGNGYAKIATDIILYIAFKILNLHKVYLNVFEDNLRANKFYEKYGFISEGKFADSLIVRGNYKSINWYSILKLDYEKNHKNIEITFDKKYINKIGNHINKIAIMGKNDIAVKSMEAVLKEYSIDRGNH